MTNPTETFLVAAVQAAPVFLDKDATVAKTIELIKEASAKGARLIAFPETWIPGYPWWIWLDSPAWGMQFVSRYYAAAITVDGPELAAIADAAKAASINVVLGYVERAGSSLFIAQSIIGEDGTIIASRRKLKPTHAERYVFGEGDGSDLRVHDTPVGRLGALCCAEHIQPLSKYAMYAQNEQIHVASWPSFSVYRGAAYQLSAPANLAASQVYALEGGCYVLAPCAIVSKEMIDLLIDSPAKAPLLLEGGGYTMIYGPDSAPLCELLPEDEEGLLYATVDLSLIGIAKAAYDPAGHYSRPDALRLMINPDPQRRVERQYGGPMSTGDAIGDDREAGNTMRQAASTSELFTSGTRND